MTDAVRRRSFAKERRTEIRAHAAPIGIHETCISTRAEAICVRFGPTKSSARCSSGKLAATGVRIQRG